MKREREDGVGEDKEAPGSAKKPHVAESERKNNGENVSVSNPLSLPPDGEACSEALAARHRNMTSAERRKQYILERQKSAAGDRVVEADSMTSPSDRSGTALSDEPETALSDEPEIAPSDEPEIAPSDEPTTASSNEPATASSDQPETAPSEEPKKARPRVLWIWQNGVPIARRSLNNPDDETESDSE